MRQGDVHGCPQGRRLAEADATLTLTPPPTISMRMLEVRPRTLYHRCICCHPGSLLLFLQSCLGHVYIPFLELLSFGHEGQA